MEDARFREFLFDLLDVCGMWQSAYGTDGRNLALAEGRRSLGLDILETAQGVRPDALLAIVQAGMKARQETTSGRRTEPSDDDIDDGDDTSGDDRRQRPAEGADFLDYASDGPAA